MDDTVRNTGRRQLLATMALGSAASLAGAAAPAAAAAPEPISAHDEPGAAEPMLGDVVANEELRYGDTVPNGTYLDMVAKLPVCDPDNILCPVLIIRAEHDGIATDEDVMGFYGRLPNADKQMVKIAGLAHTALLGINRHRFHHAVYSFLSMPDRIALAKPAHA